MLCLWQVPANPLQQVSQEGNVLCTSKQGITSFSVQLGLWQVWICQDMLDTREVRDLKKITADKVYSIHIQTKSYMLNSHCHDYVDEQNLGLLFTRVDNLSVLSFSSLDMSSSPFTSFVALLWSVSSILVSFCY